MSRPGLIPAAASLAVAAPAGCGGGASDAKQIKSVSEAVSTTKDPNNCAQRQTQRYTEQTEFARGADAVNSCEANTSAADAKSVDIGAIKASGSKGTAEVAYHGAGFDGQALQGLAGKAGAPGS